MRITLGDELHASHHRLNQVVTLTEPSSSPHFEAGAPIDILGRPHTSGHCSSLRLNLDVFTSRRYRTLEK